MGSEENKKMSIDADDPRWTAYALGELHGAEHAEFEAAVAADEECAMRVAEIREMGALLEQEFAGAHDTALTADQRAAIVANATQPAGRASLRMLPRFATYAAAAVVIVGAGLLWKASQADPVEVATVTRNDAPSREAAVVIDETAPTADPKVVAGAEADADLGGVTDALETATKQLAPAVKPELNSASEKAESSAVVLDINGHGKGTEGYAGPGDTMPTTGFIGLAGGGATPGPAGPSTPSAGGPGSPSQRWGAYPGGATGPTTGGLRVGTTLDSYLSQVQGNNSIGFATPGTADPSANPNAGAFFTAGGDIDLRARSINLSEGTQRYREIQRLNQQLSQPGGNFSSALSQKDSQLSKNHTLKLNAPDESYAPIHENQFLTVGDAPLSTFSIDVDTASYANMRRMLRAGQRPPPDAVRIEEMLNYFAYDDAEPTGEHPFSIGVELARCPWEPEHRIARVALRGKSIEDLGKKRRNLVFLIDVSGSMGSTVKLPLLKKAMRVLVDNLREDDRVAIVTYAGASGCALEPTACNEKAKILDAIDRMQPGGSTNGAAGINLAYDLALRSFDKEGINRVVLATDGDFNIGVSADGPLTRLIEEKAKTGVFLSVLGFGTGNLKDSKMEALADHGNGNYAYIDSLREARKVLVDQLGGTLQTIAKDVKIQIEFNPAKVGAYRLIGYENRILQAQDFNDDRKDAGEIGAGHRVTAIYQIVPVGGSFDGASVDPLRYGKKPEAATTVAANDSPELMNVKVRYKQPDGQRSTKIEHPVVDSDQDAAKASDNLRFAAAVAQFGMLLRNSRFAGTSTLESVRNLAKSSMGTDAYGYRAEFVELVEKSAQLFDR